MCMCVCLYLFECFELMRDRDMNIKNKIEDEKKFNQSIKYMFRLNGKIHFGNNFGRFSLLRRRMKFSIINHMRVKFISVVTFYVQSNICFAFILFFSTFFFLFFELMIP